MTNPNARAPDTVTLTFKHIVPPTKDNWMEPHDEVEVGIAAFSLADGRCVFRDATLADYDDLDWLVDAVLRYRGGRTALAYGAPWAEPDYSTSLGQQALSWMAAAHTRDIEADGTDCREVVPNVDPFAESEWGRSSEFARRWGGRRRREATHLARTTESPGVRECSKHHDKHPFGHFATADDVARAIEAS